MHMVRNCLDVKIKMCEDHLPVRPRTAGQSPRAPRVRGQRYPSPAHPRQAGPSPRTPAAGGAISSHVRGQPGISPSFHGQKRHRPRHEYRNLPCFQFVSVRWTRPARRSERHCLLFSAPKLMRAPTARGRAAVADAPAPNKNARDGPKQLLCGCDCVRRRWKIRCH